MKKSLLLCVFLFSLFLFISVDLTYALVDPDNPGPLQEEDMRPEYWPSTSSEVATEDVVDSTTLEGADEFADEGLYVEDLEENLEAEILPQDGIRFNLENWALGLRRFFALRAEKRAEIDREILNRLDRKLAACAEIGNENCAKKIQELIDKRKEIAEKHLAKLEEKGQEIIERFEKWRQNREEILKKRLENLEERKGKAKELWQQWQEKRKEAVQNWKEEIKERRQELKGNIQEQRQEFLETRKQKIQELQEKWQEQRQNLLETRQQNVQERIEQRQQDIQEQQERRQQNLQQRIENQGTGIQEKLQQGKESLQSKLKNLLPK